MRAHKALMESSTSPLKLSLLRGQTLLDIEALIYSISKSRADFLEVWLATELGPHLFKDTLIASLFAYAARHGKHLRVIDWTASPTIEHIHERFGTTLEGLASLEFATEIVDAQKVNLGPHIHNLRFAAIEKNGIRTPEKAGGKTLTFCAFDPELPTPLGFVGSEGKASFIRRLLGARKDFFEIGVGEGFSHRVAQSADHAVAGFAYELWQNGIQHGRFDAQQNPITGMRYLRLRKHVGLDRTQFVSRAAGFPELQLYLERETAASKKLKFYEVSIADSGIGIVDRFLATRPEFSSTVASAADHSTLINRIINESLTSKLNQAGAGHGLEQAILAVRELNGFLSLRTGFSWLYYAPGQEQTSAGVLELRTVKYDAPLACIGTQINLIYPLMEQ